ncbi:MAG: hypothetical protein R3D69_18465 [Xanthobacteraceae bacterium]
MAMSAAAPASARRRSHLTGGRLIKPRGQTAVVFPHPEAPMMQTNSLAIEKLRSSTISLPPSLPIAAMRRERNHRTGIRGRICGAPWSYPSRCPTPLLRIDIVDRAFEMRGQYRRRDLAARQHAVGEIAMRLMNVLPLSNFRIITRRYA